MNTPELSQHIQLKRLQPPVGKIPVVLDTDTYNEIDDQFALVYSLLSPDRLDVQAIYVAPFLIQDRRVPKTGWRKVMKKFAVSWKN